MFNLGDIDKDLSDPSFQPWVAIILRITGSKAATIVLLIVMIVMYFFCAVNQVTTSSRQVFAFARDKGLPFHRFLSKVRPDSGVPANAVYVTLVFTCLLALIQIGVSCTSSHSKQSSNRSFSQPWPSISFSRSPLPAYSPPTSPVSAAYSSSASEAKNFQPRNSIWVFGVTSSTPLLWPSWHWRSSSCSSQRYRIPHRRR